MPRPLNEKCLQCSRLTQVQAIDRYGNTCWTQSLCPARRRHYTTRTIRNTSRRLAYAEEQTETPPDVLDIPLGKGLPKLIVVLQVYRANQSSEVHALILQVWVDGNLRVVVPKHTLGFSQAHINLYLKDVFRVIHDKYGYVIKGLHDSVELKPDFCPIDPCPLHPMAVKEFP